MIIIDGKKLNSEIKEKVKNEIINNQITPALSVIRVGNDEASKIYVNMKRKSCEEVGIIFEEIILPENISEESIINEINKLNNNEKVSAILVQLPLPKHINQNKIINTINYKKDVDGLTNLNKGKLTNGEKAIKPCTPKGIMYIFNKYNINLSGKHVVIVGRSNLVGKPLMDLCLQKNATVTICHSKTINLKQYTKQADILISATGVKGLIKENMIKNNAVVIDVGITKENGKLYGDVDEEVYPKTSYITKVPGGVGPLTVAMLLKNTLKCYYNNQI